MKIAHTIKSARTALLTHRLRAALTVLGIVIGITAIMLVFSIGRGAQGLILSQVESLGARTLAVVPGREPKGPTDPSAVESLYSDSLKERELRALKNKANVPHVEKVMPVIFGVESVSYGGETMSPQILGGSELISEIFNIYPETGIFITEDDILSRSAAAVIGVKVKEELFGASDAVGENIKIAGKNFRIIGVLPKKGQVLFFNFDEIVVLPYTTAQQYVFGIKHFNRIILQVESDKYVDQAVADIEATLRELHGITDPEKDDFFVGSQQEIADTLKTVTDALTLFLASVAAISLLVGGIGIMNIMLVSVTERTREIGLRKAVGATAKNILSQFLIESVALTGIGGILGIILGSAFSYAAGLAIVYFAELNWVFDFPVDAALLGIAVSVFVGLLFGIYPAYKASRKSPIEALRYE